MGFHLIITNKSSSETWQNCVQRRNVLITAEPQTQNPGQARKRDSTPIETPGASNDLSVQQ